MELKTNTLQIMGTYNIGTNKIQVGQQNFNNNSVMIVDNKIAIECPMYADEDNDFYFVYKDNIIYFRDLK